MFTGIVRAAVSVVRVGSGSAATRLTVALPTELGPAAVGDSIALDGVCLTIAALPAGEPRRAELDVVPETLRKTTLGSLRAGDRVNAEPALRAGDPLGGHFVQGHVDGTATIAAIDTAGGEYLLRLEAAAELTAEMIPKGSVTLDGVSLTLVEVQPRRFSVALIPTTLEKTTLGGKKAGDRVNVETDVIGKWVRRLIGSVDGGRP
jgi:riboflavin synthase alpha subunit